MQLQCLFSRYIVLGAVLSLVSLSSSRAAEPIIQQDMNLYFSSMYASFTRIAQSSILKKNSLRSAELFFLRELKRSQSINAFLRTNSKGQIISDVIRGKDIERPLRDVSGQRWFQFVKKQRTAYHTVIKDDERGRYYLLWCSPIIKKGDRFVGAVMAKIDLWDSFYEFSDAVYYPFRIKLGKKTLFSHKWKEQYIGSEVSLAIQGIKHISVVYIQEKMPPESAVKSGKSATTSLIHKGDSARNLIADDNPMRSLHGIILLVSLLLIIGVGVIGAVLFVRRNQEEMRRKEHEEL